MKTLKIGSKKLKDITKEELIELCLIEKVHSFLEYWSKPIITDFDNKMFSDTIVIDYHSERLSDGIKGKTIVFFFKFTDFNYHWHNDNRTLSVNNRLSIESIRYLIKLGYDIPIY